MSLPCIRVNLYGIGENKLEFLEPDDIDFAAYLKETDSHQKVRQASVYLEEIVADIKNPSKDPVIQLPWSKTHEDFAFRPGEVTLYAGSNGGGKSLITGQVALHLIKQQQKVCIASFEMKPKRSLERMLRQFSGENINKPRFSDKADYVEELVNRLKNFSRNHLWFYDQQGTTSAAQVIAVARYCAVKLGVTHFFIDSLMKCVQGEDDYNGQKWFIDELCALARDHGMHIHLIHHIRKLTNEESTPNKHDIKGTGAIADQVDNVFMVWRNKKKEHQISAGNSVDVQTMDAMLMCEKQRNGEVEEWYSLWFHRESQQFVDQWDGMPLAFDRHGNF
jgi:twinkle protein